MLNQKLAETSRKSRNDLKTGRKRAEKEQKREEK